jgi:hypothetical protein
VGRSARAGHGIGAADDSRARPQAIVYSGFRRPELSLPPFE